MNTVTGINYHVMIGLELIGHVGLSVLIWLRNNRIVNTAIVWNSDILIIIIVLIGLSRWSHGKDLQSQPFVSVTLITLQRPVSLSSPATISQISWSIIVGQRCMELHSKCSWNSINNDVRLKREMNEFQSQVYKSS